MSLGYLARLGDVTSPTSTDVRSPTSTATEVRSPTSTSTEVRSPTSTTTDAYTAGNVTVTGGAGAGATNVSIYGLPRMDPRPGQHGATPDRWVPQMMLNTDGARVPGVGVDLMRETSAPRAIAGFGRLRGTEVRFAGLGAMCNPYAPPSAGPQTGCTPYIGPLPAAPLALDTSGWLMPALLVGGGLVLYTLMKGSGK